MKQNNIKLPKSKNAGVYAIINKTKGKCYIGQSENIQNRASSHISKLKHNRHEIEEMQKDFNNGDRFIFKILKEIPCSKIFLSKYKRRCAESYYIRCMEELKIKLYNRNYKNAEKDFFWYVTRLDSDVEKIKKEIILN